MSTVIEQAKAEFYKTENCSCMIMDKDTIIFQSYDSGIKPLVNSTHLMKGAVVADKIIGKAAALLCVYGGVKAVYGHIMSVDAQNILNQNNIEFDNFQTTDHIINKQGNDICPMEKLVSQTNSPKEAFEIITEKLRGNNHAI